MDDPRTIAILSLGPIGDAVLTTPLIDRLAEVYDEATITLLCSPRNREVHELNPHVSDVLVIRNSPSGVIDSVRTVARRRWDLYVDPKDHGSTTSRLLGTFLRYKTGVVSPRNLSFLRNAHIIPPADGPHFVDGTFGALLALGIEPPETRRPELPEVDTDNGANSTGVVLNLSAGADSRYWRVEKWRELVGRLVDSGQDRITVVSAPADAGLASEVTRGLEAIAVPTPGLVDVYRTIARARLVVTPDTSVVHIASGYDRPTVALFSSDTSNARRFAPLAGWSTVVQPDGDGRSIADIEVTAVAAACATVIDNSKSESDQKSAPREM